MACRTQLSPVLRWRQRKNSVLYLARVVDSAETHVVYGASVERMQMG